MIALYWILGYIGCSILMMFLSPIIIWVIDEFDPNEKIYLEKSTYHEKWEYAYSDFPKHSLFIFWPIFLGLFLFFGCRSLPEMIRYICGGKKQLYINSVNEKAAKIMGE